MYATVNQSKPARVSWPFKEMKVGDKIGIEKKRAARGQMYVHVYARQAGRTYSTFTQDDGTLVVERLS